MRQRLNGLARALWEDERAQSTVEYALVVAVTVALLVGISGFVLSGLSTYFADTTSVVCLPIP
ncbi:MAG: hypothetical protein ACLF0G_13530 [Candidatus Brocadiia bacterium]